MLRLIHPTHNFFKNGVVTPKSSMSLHKYFTSKSTVKKVIEIASIEANLTATETNEVIQALTDDKETPSSCQSITKR